MAKPSVYLCGQMGGLTVAEANGWRQWAENELRGSWSVLNPISAQFEKNPSFTFSSVEPNLTAAAVFAKDLFYIDCSDFVLANFAGAKTVSIGSVWELGYAYKSGKKIVAVVPKGTPFYDGHPFISQSAHVIFENLEDAIAFLQDIAI